MHYKLSALNPLLAISLSASSLYQIWDQPLHTTSQD